ncbi:MAG TPA: H-NS histone family protein [Rhodothermales bacterium]|nr:H-NS histone family protein [Rhodothermales bacterium]
MDLSNKSRTELFSLQDQILREIEKRTRQEKEEALRKIRSIADEAGIPLSEISGTPRGNKRKGKAPIKYRDPNNPENTWAGRGRKPKWLEEALARGKKVEDFAV